MTLSCGILSSLVSEEDFLFVKGVISCEVMAQDLVSVSHWYSSVQTPVSMCRCVQGIQTHNVAI